MTVLKKGSILVFDTNIFLTGIDFNFFKETIFTTPEVIDEIQVKRYKDKNRNVINRIEVAVELGKLFIEKANENYIDIVLAKSKLTGDINALSNADVGLIALALELMDTYNQEIVLYTNDYSMENLCSELNIKFMPMFKEGIKEKVFFEIYCPYCKSIFKPKDFNKVCEMCGSKLKRRPLIKEKI